MEMSLRLRLILAFLAIASLLLFVGISSYVSQHRIQSQVASLRSRGGLDLRYVDLKNVGLEIEGFWDPSGSFVSTDVEIVPGRRWPKLRGEIQSVDPVGRSITMYGVAIRVTPDTEFSDAAPGERSFESLGVGTRIEVSCQVGEAGWIARKIRTRHVKLSDKIKGTATSSELDGRAPETLELHGLMVSLAPAITDAADSAMHRIELAIQMTLTLQECRTVAHELVGRTPVESSLRSELDRDLDSRLPTSTGERLALAEHEFARHLRESSSPFGASTLGLPATEFARLLHLLEDRGRELREHVGTLIALSSSEGAAARKFLDETLDPLLVDELLPLVSAYLSEAEEALGDQLRLISLRSKTTTRIALTTSGVAAVVAIVLGLALWRSISRPLRLLQLAALEIGHGQFDARVAVDSRDEFGALATAFNKMASELAGSTLSVANLENVIDSMAGALVIVHPAGRIVRVNRAALGLLGYEQTELVGQQFAAICPPRDGEAAQPMIPTSSDGIGTIEERIFVRKDGSQVPVSFSGAELRSGTGPLQGFVCVAQDLTERKQMEERLRLSLDEKKLLLREVHHRVKNNMQVISSLLALQSGQLSDPDVVDKFQQSQSRIRSMALIHEQLYQTEDLGELDLAAYLAALTAHLLQSFGRPASVTFDLEVGDQLALDIDQAISCGLIVNELVTNSLKYAFREGEVGTISVSLTKDREGQHVLRVADTGSGIDDASPARSGSLGMSLVRTLAQQLQGHVSIDNSGGTKAQIVFPSHPERADRS